MTSEDISSTTDPIPVRVSSTTVSSSNQNNKSMSVAGQIVSGIYIIAFCQLLYKACNEAFQIRLYAIKEYGRVIHEFDPYFNYRAAEVRSNIDVIAL